MSRAPRKRRDHTVHAMSAGREGREIGATLSSTFGISARDCSAACCRRSLQGTRAFK
jgi:hypothetical protein